MDNYSFTGGLYIIRKRGESLELSIKKFRKKYMKSGILIDIREHMYYTKPSKKRKKKKEVAYKRKLREERKLTEKNRRGKNDKTHGSKR